MRIRPVRHHAPGEVYVTKRDVLSWPVAEVPIAGFAKKSVPPITIRAGDLLLVVRASETALECSCVFCFRIGSLREVVWPLDWNDDPSFERLT